MELRRITAEPTQYNFIEHFYRQLNLAARTRSKILTHHRSLGSDEDRFFHDSF